MQAIELETHIEQDGVITLPETYKHWFNKTARIILLETSPCSQNLPKAYDIYEKLDLGEGGYSAVSSADVKLGIREVLQKKVDK